MADETTRAIDRVFDLVDNGIDAVDRVINRSKYTEEQLQKQRRRHVVIDTEATAASPRERSRTSRTPPATDAPRAAVKVRASRTDAPRAAVTVVKKPRFYIVESVDPTSGGTLFVVTDGGNARAECTTRELAGQILRALEKA